MERTNRDRGQDRVVVRRLALDEAMQNLRINFRDEGEFDLVDLGTLAARGRGLVGQSHVEFLRPGVELELVDREDILAPIVHAARRKTARVVRSSMKGKRVGPTAAVQCRTGDDG